MFGGRAAVSRARGHSPPGGPYGPSFATRSQVGKAQRGGQKGASAASSSERRWSSMARIYGGNAHYPVVPLWVRGGYGPESPQNGPGAADIPLLGL
jgi:hypothetical protein